MLAPPVRESKNINNKIKEVSSRTNLSSKRNLSIVSVNPNYYVSDSFYWDGYGPYSSMQGEYDFFNGTGSISIYLTIDWDVS